MKKTFIIILIFLCIGCKKEEKNIVINIYENNNDNKIESAETDTYNNTEDILVTSKKENFDESQNISSKIDYVKSWYNENKEELKEKSNEILQNDIDTLKDLYNKANNWYNDNGDEIKESVSSAKDYVKNQYNSDKNKIIDFWNNIAN